MTEGPRKPTIAKRRLFCARYCVHQNGTRAAIEAGYSKRSAGSTSYDLLKEPDVQAMIKEINAENLSNAGIEAEDILRAIKLKAYANFADYIEVLPDGSARGDLRGLTRDQLSAIQEIKVDESGGGGGDGEREKVKRTTFKLADSLRALELLGRAKKLFTDKVEHSGEVNLAETLAKARARIDEGEGGDPV